MMIRNDPAGIYVHIPFCVRKCLYCDFPSRPAADPGEITDYFDALYTEIEAWKRADPRDELPADTVFIGGGTPSSVPADYIAGIVERLPVAEGAEITIEANPGTLDAETLALYRSCGINRISLGVQSFQDSELRSLGRIHDAAAAEKSAAMAREAGFSGLNLDLMFGFPGQTMESWEDTLGRALALRPGHLSFYSLQIEEETPFYDMIRSGQLEQISDELNRAMYHRAIDLLSEQGYTHYEISNAALPGQMCRHNRKYWTMRPYIGMGAAAHSFLQGHRFANPADIRGYINSMEKYRLREADFGAVLRERLSQPVDREDRMSDFLFTGMRLREGISLEEFYLLFGERLEARREKEIRGFIHSGDLAIEDGQLCFTRKGLDITNFILMELM